MCVDVKGFVKELWIQWPLLGGKGSTRRGGDQ